ncbi:hypothetical protein ACFQ38_16395 [Sporosarcina contaminans]|uniref:CcmD family protein n=1 Tax=Sporosarcina contaminans TaxID=633403 RepID=A0ABW3U3K1_9BACL
MAEKLQIIVIALPWIVMYFMIIGRILERRERRERNAKGLE